MNLGGGGRSEPRSRHCTPAWATGGDSVSKEEKKRKEKKREKKRKEKRKESQVVKEQLLHRQSRVYPNIGGGTCPLWVQYLFTDRIKKGHGEMCSATRVCD